MTAESLYVWAIFSEVLLLEQLNNASFAEILVFLSDAEASDDRVVAALVIGTALIAAVTFLIWLNGAHSNLNALGTTSLRFSTGWAVGCWFVPVVNLFRPYQVVTEVWHGSDPGLDDSSSLVKWWWWLYLAGGLASSVVFNVRGSWVETAELTALIAIDWWVLAAQALVVSAAILAIGVVRRVTAGQRAKVVLVDAAATG